MEALHGYRTVRFARGHTSDQTEQVLIERPLQVVLNGTPFTVLMHTPGWERELVLGLLLNEGLIHANQIPEIQFNTDSESLDRIAVTLPGLNPNDVANKRALLSATSCGICGTRELDIPEGDALESAGLSPDLLPSLHAQMRAHQPLFDQTGGSHAAALFDAGGNLLVLAEDAGRHNATDKAIGRLLDRGVLSKAHYLALSGRVSYELISKAFRARIPVVASVSAPTSMAVDFALEWGIALLAFCREGRFTRFA
ncbi:MAG: formate dehydrogenase accessory sulfurtransferase FdhD [Flavobacteriales bacterium]